MPNVMSDAQTLDILALTHALIDAGWAQGDYARTTAGDQRMPWEADTTRFCIGGAVMAAALELGVRPIPGDPTRCGDEENFVYALLESVTPERRVVENSLLVDYNDDAKRRKRDVLRLIERAAARVGK